jgi:nucleoside-diphosphate-sugar epimerase
MARFAVFGASGFIGRHLVTSLAHRGHEVRAIYRDTRLPRGERLGHAIYGIGLTADFRTRHVETVRAHVSVLADVLEAYEFESFVYLSSTRVYRGAATGREDEPLVVRPTAADDLYALSKLTGEALCLANPEPRFRVARLSNVIGAGAASPSFLASLLEEARHKSTVTFHSSPESRKDYVDLDDAARALEAIALRGSHRLYNVASGASTSNATIARLISAAFAVDATFTQGAPTLAFPDVDVSRLRQEFALTPAPFEETFARMIGGDR